MLAAASPYFLLSIAVAFLNHYPHVKNITWKKKKWPELPPPKISAYLTLPLALRLANRHRTRKTQIK